MIYYNCLKFQLKFVGLIYIYMYIYISTINGPSELYSFRNFNNKCLQKQQDCLTGIYLPKVNEWNTKAMREKCITLKSAEQRHWRCSGVFIANFVNRSQISMLWASKCQHGRFIIFHNLNAIFTLTSIISYQWWILINFQIVLSSI